MKLDLNVNELAFTVSALTTCAGISTDFINLTLCYVDIEKPSDEDIEAAIKSYLEDNQDTSIRIQQLSSDGSVVDEYLLPKLDMELEDENDFIEPTVYDQLQDLARQEVLMKALGDHNYRKTYGEAVSLLANQHIGFEIEDDVLSLNGPLAGYISNKRQGELWNKFLSEQGLSDDIKTDDH